MTIEIHPEDRALIERAHDIATGQIGDSIIAMQDAAYKLGRERGNAEKHQQHQQLELLVSVNTRLKAMLEVYISLVAEVRDSELADVACAGSMAPCEDILGRLLDADFEAVEQLHKIKAGEL